MQEDTPEQGFGSVANIAVPDDDQGGVWVTIGPETDKQETSEHDQNLADEGRIPEDVLTALASQLIEDIAEDDQSRSEWLQLREKAVGLLGLKIIEPKASPSEGGAAFEGMSTYQDSALLEAAIRFQANARGELLPAEGPVKVKNDGEQTDGNNAQAEALEGASNKYLTVRATEYVPDSDKLFFQVGWSGCGIKKGYHCPIRRRPVIESIDAKDLIVSNNATDIDNAGRVTHVIKMSKTVLIRMQIAGAYREADLNPPTEESTAVDRKIASTQGISTSASSKPENVDRTIYECYADLDIPGFEHKLNGKITGLPIPYRVTIDKSSKTILEIRRNWKEGDEQCMKRKTFVMYPFIPAFGFYPLGLMHVLGNTTNIITAAMRILIDNGMYSNFNMFAYAKTGQGQDKTDFRAGPGQGIPFNVPVGGKLSDVLMPLPSKPVDAAFIQFLDQIRVTAQRIGGTAEVQVGEGNQQAPVGTTIALIEQAQKVMSAVHKRIHQAQSEELRMFQELLREDPEALWRGDPQPPHNAELIKQALENYELSPRADPNVPSHMVRLAKAEAGRQIVKDNPQGWDIVGATEWYCDQVGVPELKRFILPPPPPQAPNAAPDPNVIRAGTQIQIQQMKASEAEKDRELKLAAMAQTAKESELERQARSQEHISDLAKEVAIHPLSQAIVQETTQGLIQ
jgi:hypothetical protein